MKGKMSHKRGIISVILMGVATIGLFYTGFAFPAETVGDVAARITGTMENVAKLITAISYIAGLGFAIGAILKFKAHKDNPTQIPVGTPIALLFIAAALIFMPSLFGVTGETLFGSSKQIGSPKGITEIK